MFTAPAERVVRRAEERDPYLVHLERMQACREGRLDPKVCPVTTVAAAVLQQGKK